MANGDKLVTFDMAKAMNDEIGNDIGDLKSAFELSEQEIAKKANRSSVTADRTISGTGSVTVEDTLDEPAKVVIGLEPKQDLHGYDKPWVGGAGKNLLLPLATGGVRSGVTASNGENGSVIFSGTATEYGGRDRPELMTTPFVLKAGTYVSSCTTQSSTPVQMVVQTYPENSVISSGINTPFTLNTDTEVTVGYNLSNGTAYDGKPQYFQLELGSSATSYEPYSNICPIEGYDNIAVLAHGNENIIAGRLNNVTVGTNALTAGANQFSTYYAHVKKGETYTLVGDNAQSVYAYIESTDVADNSTYAVDYPQRFVETTQASGGFRYRQIVAPITGWVALRCALDFKKGAIYKGAVVPSSNYQIEPNTDYVTLSLSSIAGGTVYGGTLTINEDGTGMLVVDKTEHICDGTEVVDESSTNGYMMICSGHNAFMEVYDIQNIPGSYPIPVVSHYNAVAYKISTELNVGDSTTFYGTHQKSIGFKTLFDEISEFKAYLAAQYQAGTPVTFVLPLATPQTYPLTASQVITLLGHTQIITDTDEALTLTYKTDKYAPKSEAYAAFPESSVGRANMLTVTDGADNIPLKTLSVAMEPKQDLHGYDKPWVGGAGKNLAPITVDNAKRAAARYQSLVWNGNVLSANGVTFTFDEDAAGNVKSITANTGSSGASSNFALELFPSITIPAGTYIVSGCPSGFNDVWIDLFEGGTSYSAQDVGNGITITYDSDKTIAMRFRVASGTVFNNTKIYPMIRLASVADSTYEPYSNICPITGLDDVTVTRTGKNLLKITGKTSTISGITYTINDDGSIKVSGTATAASFFYPSGNGIPSDLRGKRVILSGGGQNVLFRAWHYDGTSIKTTSGADTSPIELNAGTLDIYVASGTTVNTTIYPMVRLSTITDSSFEPYASNTLTLPIQSISGSTVYGGTVTVNEDGTGTLVVDMAKVTLTGNENWKTNSVAAGLYYLENMPYKLIKNNGMAMSDKFAATDIAGTSMTVGQMKVSGTNVNFKTQYATVDDWKNALSTDNVTVCYETSTTDSYSLTATQLRTLLGHNTIWCDAGQVSMTYRQDTGMAIGKSNTSAITNAMKALTSYTETKVESTGDGLSIDLDEPVAWASRNYSAGDIIAIGSELWRADDTIAKNAAINYNNARRVWLKSYVGGTGNATGALAHAEGYSTHATGDYSHAEGYDTYAYSLRTHAEGWKTHAGDAADKLAGNDAHAEGSETTASGSASHAEGSQTTASGYYSHAEGKSTTASGYGSHAAGIGTNAAGNYQFVFGKNNVTDASEDAGVYVEIVGNGSSSNRSNARTLDWSGNESLQGSLTLGKGTADETTITAAQLKALLAMLT